MSVKFRGFNSLGKNYSKLDPSTRWKEVLPSGGSTSMWWNASICRKLTRTALVQFNNNNNRHYRQYTGTKHWSSSTTTTIDIISSSQLPPDGSIPPDGSTSTRWKYFLPSGGRIQLWIVFFQWMKPPEFNAHSRMQSFCHNLSIAKEIRSLLSLFVKAQNNLKVSY